MAKIKGTIMIEVVKFLRSRKDEARRLIPERLHHYLQGRLLATSWHPEEDYLELMHAVVKLFSRSDMSVSVWEEVARLSSPAYFTSTYKAVVLQGLPARSLPNFESFWRLRHDTGQANVVLEGDHGARIELRDYALVGEESCLLIQGTIWGLLDHSGAEEIDLQHSLCRARGDALCEWRASWKEKTPTA
jgi:hypothetical protein